MRPRRAVIWLATGTGTRGGVASYVRAVQGTPLWSRWSVRHVATHQDGSPVHKMFRFAKGASTFWLLLLTQRPALVHVHTSARGSFVRKSILAWSARARGVPVVIHVHDGGFADFHDRQPRPLQRFLVRTLEMADAVVALGPSWASRLQELAPEARLVVVPNAVRMPRLEARSASDSVLVLFVGRVGEEKGTSVLLEAWRRVLNGLPSDAPARLVAAGDGDVERFRRLVKTLGLSESVDLPGWVSSHEIDALLRRADVLVLPSRWEGQPMSVLEAMAHGVPVVATAVGGIPDLVDPECGILVPPDDVPALVESLGRLVRDPDLRARMGAAGARRAREFFDVEVTWRALDALYSEVTRR